MRQCCLVLIALPALAFGQQASPVAELDTNLIRIGEQVQLTIRVDLPKGGVFQWPALPDTLPQHMEVVRDAGIDTVLGGDDGSISLRRRIIITSFDSGAWAIEPIPMVVNGDSVETNALALQVATVQVDTTQAIKDIKGIYEVAPDRWAWLRKNWPWLAGGAAVLLAALGFLLWFFRRKKTEVVAPPPTLLPLHVRMRSALEEVERKRLWQQGLHKQYHTEVTDILRHFVEERFGTPALEKTTDELMQELKLSSMSAEQREKLGNMLRLSDLVKFAKLMPAPSENEQLIASALRLVVDNAIMDTPQPPTGHAH